MIIKDAQKVWITPEKAAQFLETEVKNRKPRAHKVEALKKALDEDRFVFNGDPIRFNAAMQMIDGKHRCTASVLSGKGFYAAIVTGLSEAARKTIDTGVPRRPQDILEMFGELTNNEAKIVAGAARHVITHDLPSSQWASPGGYFAKYLGNDQVYDWYLENQEEVNDAISWANTWIPAQASVLPKSAFVALLLLASREDPELADAFLRQVGRGVELESGSNAESARTILLTVKMGARKMSLNNRILTVAKLFKSTAAGRQIKHIGNAAYRPSADSVPMFPISGAEE